MNNIERHSLICDKIKDLYCRKNHDYGDAFSRARSIIPHYTLGKLYDKFARYMQLELNGDRKVLDETIEDTLMDMANYCIMELVERMKERSNDNLES